MSRFILNALGAEADLQPYEVKFFIKLISANVALINLRRMSVEAT